MSERKEAVLRIELRSDLCVGSGYSFAGIIDSDVCCDEYGVPYIPAKRIRGCLRETLEGSLYSLYKDEEVEKLFGKAGSNRAGDLLIGNARIPGYESLIEGLKGLRSRDKGLSYYGTQEILGCFTHVIGQTAIQENGTADDSTLRYTRVVNRISPLSNKGEALTFEAEVSFSSDYEMMLKDAVSATRHIGLKRNRGFGNVRCSLTGIHRIGIPVNRRVDAAVQSVPSGRKRIPVRVCNLDPLMLSERTENESATYISGQSVLGLLAERYLAGAGRRAESDEFRDLFLNGQTVYSNLYPADADRIYYPAPVYINKLKLTGKYVNVLASSLPKTSERSQDYVVYPGNQPKKLKGKYVSFGGGQIAVKEVERDVVYHHSHSKKNANGEDGILYGMEVIRPNQIFEGFIETSCDAYAQELTGLLEQGDLYFGKSRSSQYGRCVLEKPATHHSAPLTKTIKAGQHLVVTFLSDAIFLSERGEYTIYRDEVESLVAEELGIQGNIRKNRSSDPVYLSNLLTTLATGYRSVWNLRRDTIPAIQAGSCIVYPLYGECVITKQFIGERNLEGYGLIRIDAAEEMPYDGLEEVEKLQESGHYNFAGTSGISSELRNLTEGLLVDQWIDELICDYLRTGSGRIQITNNALGRITLMLKESLESTGSSGDYKGQFANLCSRIGSIKSPSVKREGERILGLVASRKGGKEWELNLSERGGSSDMKMTVSEDSAARIQTIREELFYLETAGGKTRMDAGKRVESRINSRWGEYLSVILTEQKYMGGDQ